MQSLRSVEKPVSKPLLKGTIRLSHTNFFKVDFFIDNNSITTQKLTINTIDGK